jgi:hypothetical protein
VSEAYHDQQESVRSDDASNPTRSDPGRPSMSRRELLDRLMKEPMIQGDLESMFRELNVSISHVDQDGDDERCGRATTQVSIRPRLFSARQSEVYRCAI